MRVRLVLLAFLGSARAFPADKAPEQRQLLYRAPERQQFVPQVPQIDLSLLEPQFQIPAYHFGGQKQAYPGVQPQILFYQGAPNPGQFLLPGSPPGNFLVPQPGPNVILRDAPPRPVFVAGYPKPAHVPPIEKDAEEIPTNPAKIPPLTPKTKPEKVEAEGKKQATEAEVLAAADRDPAFNSPELRPGQRFFVLNGQPLFGYGGQLYPGLKYSVPAPQQEKAAPQEGPFRNQFDLLPEYRQDPANLILLNRPAGFQFQPQVRFDSEVPFLQLQQDDDAVVVDAREQEQDSEVVTAPEKSGEPTISQAQPGAIALAGPGGVAAAAPRANAFVGKEGLAISSPQATAVAGPTRDEIEQDDKKPNKNRKP